MPLKTSIDRVTLLTLAALAPCCGLARPVAPGVPEPSHCLEAAPPDLPAGWPDTAADDFYYVDNSDPRATDSNNPFGSRRAPRQSVPDGELAAGSYVELHGGPYVAQRYVTIAQGTAAAPVWI
ncbi:MAG: hypothetical protein ACREIV_13370, partial [Planctomycetaceae bacterium]